LHVRCEPQVAEQLQAVSSQFENLAKTMLEQAGLDVARPIGAAAFSLSDADGFIPLEGIIDREAERKRQLKEAEKLRGHIASNEKKLNNAGFIAKAPPEVVEQVKEHIATLTKQLDSVNAMIEALAGE